MAEKRTEAARQESVDKVEVDDLDNIATPEMIMLSAVSGEGAQDRSDRTILMPWVKFLWESYCQCLELLRTNSRVERLYHDIAQQAFKFCLKYQRKTEFRKLCDKLRNHLDLIIKQVPKQSPAAPSINLNNAEVYVDTVGPPEKYQAKLEGIFPGINITVAKKADSLYPCVSAASICAKVARDHAIKDWKFQESEDLSGPWGSGYPGDAVTKKFLLDNIHPIFGFPSLVRFSWKTSEKLLEEKGVKIEFEEVEPAEDESIKNNPSVSQYFSAVTMAKPGNKGKSSRKHPYFRERGLTQLESF